MGPGPSSEKHSSQRNTAALLVALCDFHVVSSLTCCMEIKGSSQVLGSSCHNVEPHRTLARTQGALRVTQSRRVSYVAA